MLRPDDIVTEVEHDDDLAVVVVRTERHTDFETKLKKRTQTSGCAQGTAFGDLMEALEGIVLPPAPLAGRRGSTASPTPSTPRPRSISRPARSTAACSPARIGRSSTWRTSAATTPWTRSRAGCSATGETGADKIFYTTGRLTSEMVIKTVRMGIPILVSRSGFTAWGVELARKTGLTLDRPRQGQALPRAAGEERIVFDQDLAYVEEESIKGRRKGAEGR